MYTAAVFLPLLGAIVAGLFGRLIGERLSQIVTTGLLFVSAILGCIILFQFASTPSPTANTIQIFTWIASGELRIPWALRFDMLSAVMVFVVTFCSA